MLLNKSTWVATYTYKDVIDGITTDPVPPAHVIPVDGLECWGSLSEEPIPLAVTITPFDWFAKGGIVCLKVLQSPLVP